MSKSGKPYEIPLEPDLAQEILNIPIPVDEDTEPPATMGERVERATKAVQEANEYLETSSMARIIADTLMRQLKKRGTPRIMVKMDGTVVLLVTYEDGRTKKPKPPVRKRTHKSDLPLMDELREMAKSLGVDISHLGRKRRAIYELLKKEKDKQEASLPPEPGEADDKPPKRLVDEVTESDAPEEPRPRIKRRRKKADGTVEETDIGDIL